MKYLKNIIKQCKEEADYWRKQLPIIDGLETAAQYPLASIQNLADGLDVKLKIMKAFNKRSDGDTCIKVGNYFVIMCTEHGLSFRLNEMMEDIAYKYICGSYEDLRESVNSKLISLLSPILNMYDLNGDECRRKDPITLSKIMSYFKDIECAPTYALTTNARFKYADVIVRELLDTLQSEEVKPYIELAEKYVDLLIDRGKEFE